MVAVQQIWSFGVGWGFFSKNFSVEVGFLWEGAAGSLDDDVGGVVRRLHAPIQGLFLDELRQEPCGDSKKVRGNPQETGNGNMYVYEHKDSYLLQMHHLHRLCQRCPWGQSSALGMC